MKRRIKLNNITHPEMVAGLAKRGEDIINELTPLSSHLLHMAVGIAGEAGELAQAIYISADFNSIDKENVVEELGDLEFYLEGLRQGLQLNRDKTVEVALVHQPYETSFHKVKDNAIQLNIECSVLLDFIKKSAFYVKPVKTDLVIESLIKINNFMLELREAFVISRDRTIEHNIAKLGERYQGHNYSNEQAIDRADKG